MPPNNIVDEMSFQPLANENHTFWCYDCPMFNVER